MRKQMPKKTKPTCDMEYKPLTLEEAIEHCEESVDDTPCGQEHKQLAEWLMELDRLKTTPIGNIYLLRQALVKAHTMLMVCDWPKGTDMKGVADLMKEIETAIDAPARNCDVGTVDDQKVWFLKFCKVANGQHCRNCLLRNAPDCSLAWAQMPYEE